MIEYTADKYGIFFAFSLRGSVFPKSFGFSVACAVVTATLHWWLTEKELRDEVDIGSKGTTIVSMFTFVLGFLLVFRAQQAYSRWWEGGSLLQELRGEWFNAFSCLLAFGNTAPDKKGEVMKFNHRLARLLSMLHGASLAQVSSMDTKEFEVIDLEDFLDPALDKKHQCLDFLDKTFDSCEVALQWIQRLIGEANDKVTIKVAPPILSRVYNQLGNGIVKLSNARKIAKFPMPFPFAQMVTVMLMTHWLLAAWVCATSIVSRAWAVILVFAVIMSYWSIHFIALELEDPFGSDSNDLPLQEMQRDLNKSIKALLDPVAMKSPEFAYNAAYHENMYLKTVNLNKKLHDSVQALRKERDREGQDKAEEVAALGGSTPEPLPQTTAQPPQAVPAAPTATAQVASVAAPTRVASATPVVAPAVFANADHAASNPDSFAEHLKVSKGMERHLSKAVAELENIGKQLLKNCEMQAGLWGVLSNMFQRAPPTTWQNTSSSKAPRASSAGSAEDTVVVNGVTTNAPRSQSTSFDPAGHMPGNYVHALHELQAYLRAQKDLPEHAVATDVPDSPGLEIQDIRLEPTSLTTSIGPSSRMGECSETPPTEEPPLLNILVGDKVNEVTGPKQMRSRLSEKPRKISDPARDPIQESLHDAVRTGDTVELQRLLSNGANVNAKDSDDQVTPLHVAASGDNADAANILIEARADVDAQNGSGITPLMGAAENNATGVAELLLSARAQVNAVDSEDMTPLHWVARLGHLDFAALLISAGADINKKTDAGYTPFAMAQDWGTTEMASLLEEHGAVRYT
jgi:predicted membrane chloride channel (bestrophin family)